jgi:hypothetical protein
MHSKFCLALALTMIFASRLAVAADPVTALPDGWQNSSLEQLLSLAQQIGGQADNEQNQKLQTVILDHVWPKYLAANAQVANADRTGRHALVKALGPRISLDQWQDILLRNAGEGQPTDLAQILNLNLGNFGELILRFRQQPDTPAVIAVRSSLSDYAWQTYLRPEVPVTLADAMAWHKLVEIQSFALTPEQRRLTVMRLAREHRPSDVNRMLAGRAEVKGDGVRAPPISEVFSAKERSAIAAALEARFLGPDDQEELARVVDYNQMTEFWTALGRCGWTKPRLSDMSALLLTTSSKWRDWTSKGLGRTLVYLQWSNSEMAHSARRQVVDRCIERQIYRFADDPMDPDKAGRAVDPQLAAYLRQKLVKSGGEVCEPVAVLLSWCGTWSEREETAWKRLLDQKLQDPALQGEVKASWLLARGYAEAAVRGTTERAYKPLRGERWLNEALALSSAEQIRLPGIVLLARGYRGEMLFDHARSVFADAKASFSEAGQAELARLTQEIDLAQQRAQEAAQKPR